MGTQFFPWPVAYLALFQLKNPLSFFTKGVKLKEVFVQGILCYQAVKRHSLQLQHWMLHTTFLLHQHAFGITHSSSLFTLLFIYLGKSEGVLWSPWNQQSSDPNNLLLISSYQVTLQPSPRTVGEGEDVAVGWQYYNGVCRHSNGANISINRWCKTKTYGINIYTNISQKRHLLSAPLVVPKPTFLVLSNHS